MTSVELQDLPQARENREMKQFKEEGLWVGRLKPSSDLNPEHQLSKMAHRILNQDGKTVNVQLQNPT